MNSQEIIQKNENKTLKIDYGNYSKIQGELFPTTIKIAASDIKNTSTIDVDYKSVEFNKPVSFPFSIPSNYQQIVLK